MVTATVCGVTGAAGTPDVVRFWQNEDRRRSPDVLQKGISVVLCTYTRPQSVGRFLDSLTRQRRLPDELIVVDASADSGTERLVLSRTFRWQASYWRVEGALRGLTRQRNFALQRVACDLVAFFDDDVVLAPDCLYELERAHRSMHDVAGAGCFAEAPCAATRLWRVRRALGAVPSLRPGTYSVSGMSVPWRFHEPTDRVVDGDWLPGCAMMVRTADARDLLFDETLTGYAQGEDLDFSLRLRRRGRLVMAGAARCVHLHEAAGRPDARRLGEMEIWNRYRIWRRAYSAPSWAETGRFAWAWAIDTVMLMRDVIRPGRSGAAVRRIAGRLHGAVWILTSRLPVA